MRSAPHLLSATSLWGGIAHALKFRSSTAAFLLLFGILAFLATAIVAVLLFIMARTTAVFFLRKEMKILILGFTAFSAAILLAFFLIVTALLGTIIAIFTGLVTLLYDVNGDILIDEDGCELARMHCIRQKCI